MPTLDLEQSQNLLLRVVEALYAQRHSPVPGALVKTQLIRQAKENGNSFSEQELGFKSFVDFVRATPGIGLQIRIGSDMILAPSGATQTLSAYSRPLPRLRRDFWRAFIEFPSPETTRLYDEAEDKIFYEEASTQRKGIKIEPVPHSLQIQWRRQFAEEQPEDVKNTLLAALEGTGRGPFNEFARRLRESPTVMQAWNRYFQKLITDYVETWATANDISSDRWSAGALRTRTDGSLAGAFSKPQIISQRAELYNLFDSLPIEDLLQLRIPLEWVLKLIRDKQ